MIDFLAQNIFCREMLCDKKLAAISRVGIWSISLALRARLED